MANWIQAIQKKKGAHDADASEAKNERNEEK